jgi:hypothetical protein
VNVRDGSDDHHDRRDRRAESVVSDPRGRRLQRVRVSDRAVGVRQLGVRYGDDRLEAHAPGVRWTN